MKESQLAITLSATLILGACAVAVDKTDTVAASGDVALFTDLGNYHRTTSTKVEEAGRFFDQGLRLTYAFNHAEAIKAFERAAALDTTCAFCYWGIAYAYGPNINLPMDSASGVAAYAALEKARARSANASEVERALIDALATRYVAVPPADRAALDQAYAKAMREVRGKYPDDLDVVTFSAEAVMNLSPWDYWTKDGKAKPGMDVAIADLEGVLKKNADHPGACHYYIHAVEAAQPEKAVACSERLAALMPGAGHIVHMPAHIYIRVGRWSDAITANEHAVHTDETYIKDRAPTGAYPVAYYPHNYHFLSFAATMAGKGTQAISAARSVTEKVTPDIARAVPPVEGLVPYLHLTLVRFGKWSEVLATPLPPNDLRLATALAQYARGVALVATRDTTGARAAHDTVRAILAATKDPLTHSIIDVANHVLLGEIAARGGDLAGAEAHFRQAVTVEDGHQYMEPPHWYFPVRHSLGAVLLEQKKAAEAEKVYLADLVKFPENIWSLRGLQASLRAQGKDAAATAVDARIAKLGADSTITGSRY